MVIALVAAIVLAQATAAPPTPSAPAAQPAAAGPAKPEKAPKPKMICHDEVATGSIISNRVCRTPEQVEAERLQARRDNDALSDHLAACHGAAC